MTNQRNGVRKWLDDGFEQVFGPAGWWPLAQERHLEGYRAGVGEFEPESAIAELVLAFVQHVGSGPGRRGLGRRVNATGPDKGRVEPRARNEAGVAHDYRPAVLEKQRYAVEAERDAVLAAAEQGPAELGPGAGIGMDRGAAVERGKLVEPDGDAWPPLRAAPSGEKVAYLIHNLIKVEVPGNQVGKGGAAAGHGDVEPTAPGQA